MFLKSVTISFLLGAATVLMLGSFAEPEVAVATDLVGHNGDAIVTYPLN